MSFDKEKFYKAILTKTKQNMETGCLEWIGAKSNRGYGRIRIKSKLYSPHRVFFEIFYNKDPGNLMVCHICDNPCCINPKHLFLGTRSDNMKDCYKKGRLTQFKNIERVSGENVKSSKLKKSDVNKIKLLLKEGFTQTIIAFLFSINKSQINRIAKRKAWKKNEQGDNIRNLIWGMVE